MDSGGLTLTTWTMLGAGFAHAACNGMLTQLRYAPPTAIALDAFGDSALVRTSQNEQDSVTYARALWCGVALSAIPAGALVDRYNYKNCAQTGLVLLVFHVFVSCSSLAFTSEPPVRQAELGLGGTMHGVGLAMLSVACLVGPGARCALTPAYKPHPNYTCHERATWLLIFVPRGPAAAAGGGMPACAAAVARGGPGCELGILGAGQRSGLGGVPAGVLRRRRRRHGGRRRARGGGTAAAGAALPARCRNGQRCRVRASPAPQGGSLPIDSGGLRSEAGRVLADLSSCHMHACTAMPPPIARATIADATTRPCTAWRHLRWPGR